MKRNRYRNLSSLVVWGYELMTCLIICYLTTNDIPEQLFPPRLWTLARYSDRLSSCDLNLNTWSTHRTIRSICITSMQSQMPLHDSLEMCHICSEAKTTLRASSSTHLFLFLVSMPQHINLSPLNHTSPTLNWFHWHFCFCCAFYWFIYAINRCISNSMSVLLLTADKIYDNVPQLNKRETLFWISNDFQLDK